MYIIAEIGSNCFKTQDDTKNLNNALKQIEIAKECGASAVKFQYLTSQDLFNETVKGIKQIEMPREWLQALKRHCNAVDIDFMCSAFSVEGFEIVEPFVEMHKLASPELHDPDLRNYLFKNELPVMFSLGCCPLEDDYIWLSAMRKDIDIPMECVSKYPADMHDYDIMPLHDLMITKNISWGLSDHTLTTDMAIMANKAGASCFEKHVDFLYDERITPDSSTSIDAKQFKQYCDELRKSYKFTSNYLKRRAKAMYGRIIGSNGRYYRPVNLKAET
jgi:sialic acid synthase SpsE